MKQFAQLIILILLAVIPQSCDKAQKREIQTQKITFTKEGELSIFKSASDQLIMKFDIEIAETPYETQTGLMYRESLGAKQGMLFIFPEMAMHSFYMKNTLIPLDIIYIDDQMRIVSFQENAQPLDETALSSEVPVQYVLELNAGMAEKLTIEVGDTIKFERIGG